MNGDSTGRPPIAQPTDAPPSPPGSLDAAVSAPFDYAPAPPASPVYPDLAITHGQALIDLLAVAAALYAGRSALAGMSELLQETLEDLGILIQNTVLGVLTLTLVALAMYARRLPYSTVGLNRPKLSTLSVATLATVVACFTVSAVVGVVFLVIRTVFSDATLIEAAQERAEFFAIVPDFSIWTFLLFAAFAGFHEELLFRGFGLPRFVVVIRSRWIAVGICSLIFGLLHIYQGPMSIPQATGLGIVFCLSAMYARSIWPGVIAHAIFNGIQLALIPKLREMLPELLEQLRAQQAMQ